ncbi:MAG: sensor histidine kinase [Chthoniobacterales bacterium]
MSATLSPVPRPDSSERWRFLRDVLVFELKMLLDNVRDFALMPLSLVAALFDLLVKGEREGALFYQVLAWGAHSERVIDVYSALENQEEVAINPNYTVDAVVARLEQVLTREVEKGGTAASVKAAMDRTIDQIHRETSGPRDQAKRSVRTRRGEVSRSGRTRTRPRLDEPISRRGAPVRPPGCESFPNAHRLHFYLRLPLSSGENAPPMMGAVGRAAWIGFTLAVIALLGSGWLSYRNIQRISRNDALVVRTHEVLDEIRDISATLSEAESQQRSYLITGERLYLAPYRAAAGSAHARIVRLRNLTADNPIQQERTGQLLPLIDGRVESLQRGVAVYDGGGMDTVRSYVMAGRGRHQMETIQSLLQAMEKTELDLLKRRESESRVSYRTAVVTLWLSTLVGLILVGAGYRLMVRELATRRRGTEALARANDELESRVERRTADLNFANESLQRSNRELEQFASVASHDLQEPLRKIQAFGDRIQTRCAAELGEQGRDYLARMLASATRMRSLIDALLSFSRVTTKAQPFTLVNLETTAEEVVSDLEDRVLRMNGRVEIGPLPTLEADPAQMRQLLQNLIGNGLKFARPNEPPQVEVKSRLLPVVDGEIESCELTVRDNGIGFEEVYLDRIFELFQRLHGRQEYEGTGMGLAICRKIVERHGGSITAKSALDAGATFLVTLPLRQEKQDT